MNFFIPCDYWKALFFKQNLLFLYEFAAFFLTTTLSRSLKQVLWKKLIPYVNSVTKHPK